MKEYTTEFIRNVALVSHGGVTAVRHVAQG
jgi:hypothetical protein